MGFLDNILGEKKRCDICNKELGRVFGKRKLEDGIMCPDCESKLSPFFDGRRSSTVAQIKDQLEYRAANARIVANFQPTRLIEAQKRIMIDENSGTFLITGGGSNWRDRNPDVIYLKSITGCKVDIKESKTKIEPPEEDKTQAAEPAKPQPFGVRPQPPAPVPAEPQYEYHYDIDMTIFVNHPYFDEIHLDITPHSLDSNTSAEYQKYEDLAYEIREALTGEKPPVRGINNPVFQAAFNMGAQYQQARENAAAQAEAEAMAQAAAKAQAQADALAAAAARAQQKANKQSGLY
ncbi:MAG: DUF4428 domain-containing protein [Coriobacteriales bacterium]|nr:DUF4428 domain-containing protein [Coriobacteriales bacterium]